jgi:uncharacterized protein YndB with AHSA1/START domain
MELELSVDIDAPPAKVWATLVDVENWPLWSESMETVERLDKTQPFGLGSEVRIKQPKLPPLVWKLVEFNPGLSFAWASGTRFVKTWAEHRVEAAADGRSKVTLGIRQSGPLAWLAALYFGKTTRRYVEMEADGLKRFCESS